MSALHIATQGLLDVPLNMAVQGLLDLGSGEQSATPGFLRAGYQAWLARKLEEERLAREERAQDEPKTQPEKIARYAKDSAVLNDILWQLDEEAREIKREIAALEKRKSERARRDALIKQQELVMAEIKKAIVMEEMEVLDVAYVAAVAMLIQ